jgi:predicted RNase H-like HicB family nuclease
VENDLESLLGRAEVERLDDGTYFAEIEGLAGVWGNGDTEPESLAELRSALGEWLAASQSQEGEVVILPAGQSSKTISVPLLERILRNAGISSQEWERAGESY